MKRRNHDSLHVESDEVNNVFVFCRRAASLNFNSWAFNSYGYQSLVPTRQEMRVSDDLARIIDLRLNLRDCASANYNIRFQKTKGLKFGNKAIVDGCWVANDFVDIWNGACDCLERRRGRKNTCGEC